MSLHSNVNLAAAWGGFLLGCLSGAVQGLFFHGEMWLGGYASWARRMLRLGHISFFGIGLLNLAFALTFAGAAPLWPSRLLLAGAIGMPAVCYLSAFRPVLRHLFAVPVLSIAGALALATWRILQ